MSNGTYARACVWEGLKFQWRGLRNYTRASTRKVFVIRERVCVCCQSIRTKAIYKTLLTKDGNFLERPLTINIHAAGGR